MSHYTSFQTVIQRAIDRVIDRWLIKGGSLKAEGFGDGKYRNITIPKHQRRPQGTAA